MIGYLLKYQNSYVYSNLFLNNFVDLINKGIKVSNLLGSNIFNYQFDYDQWPGTNSNVKKILRPFNKSIFDLRYQYPSVFRDIWLKDEDRAYSKENAQNRAAMKRSSMGKGAKARAVEAADAKVFKIKYTLNILPSMSEDEGSIIEALANCDEYDIFL